MGQFSIAVTKQTSWRGAEELFSNVYTYNNALSAGDAAVASDVADELVNAEKQVHADSVTFMEVRAWESGGTPVENEPLFKRDLSGTGALPDNPDMDREACFVVRFSCARPDALGRKVYLRKWLHSCNNIGNTANWTSGTAMLNEPGRLQLRDYAQRVYDPLTGEVDLNLCSDGGRLADGGLSIYPYVEHHEFTYQMTPEAYIEITNTVMNSLQTIALAYLAAAYTKPQWPSAGRIGQLLKTLVARLRAL